MLRAKVDEDPFQGLMLRALKFDLGGLMLRAASPILVAPSDLTRAPTCVVGP